LSDATTPGARSANRAALPPERDPERLLEVYLRDPEVHPYGIADVAQLWSASRWWRRGDAVVGLMDLPGSPLPVVYAVAADRPAETLGLLARLDPLFPPGFVITGPDGLTAHLAPARAARWSRRYVKMSLRRPQALPAWDPSVTVLGRDDLSALLALYATDPAAGDFFHPGLLDTGAYLGIHDGDRLVAAAGVHVLDGDLGVAAIGNVATAPTHRRRGLGRRVVAALCHRLRADVEVVGLNVAEDNAAARRLYRDLGFDPLVRYEEAELVRPG
jgi:ribosomal protein S18 acetylase RimI-like enzyme